MTDGFALKSWVISLLNKTLKKSNKYSTDETVVGTWIDGKPIYRKTLTKLKTSDDTEIVYFDASDLNIEDTVSIKAYCYYSSKNNNPIVIYGYLGKVEGSKYKPVCFVYYDKATKSIVLSKAKETDITKCVTIEYTKTTDKATS